jgi:hypothetical protein
MNILSNETLKKILLLRFFFYLVGIMLPDFTEVIYTRLKS